MLLPGPSAARASERGPSAACRAAARTGDAFYQTPPIGASRIGSGHSPLFSAPGLGSISSLLGLRWRGSRMPGRAPGRPRGGLAALVGSAGQLPPSPPPARDPIPAGIPGALCPRHSRPQARGSMLASLRIAPRLSCAAARTARLRGLRLGGVRSGAPRPAGAARAAAGRPAPPCSVGAFARPASPPRGIPHRFGAPDAPRPPTPAAASPSGPNHGSGRSPRPFADRVLNLCDSPLP